MDEHVKKLEVMFGKAETELDALSYKVDLEYKSLTKDQQADSKAPCRVVGSVQGLREELAQVASEVEEIKKQQKEAMSMVETQLKTLCSQFDELSEAVGQQKQQQGEAAP